MIVVRGSPDLIMFCRAFGTDQLWKPLASATILLAFFIRHISNMSDHFDYGYNMQVCITAGTYCVKASVWAKPSYIYSYFPFQFRCLQNVWIVFNILCWQQCKPFYVTDSSCLNLICKYLVVFFIRIIDLLASLFMIYAYCLQY